MIMGNIKNNQLFENLLEPTFLKNQFQWINLGMKRIRYVLQSFKKLHDFVWTSKMKPKIFQVLKWCTVTSWSNVPVIKCNSMYPINFVKSVSMRRMILNFLIELSCNPWRNSFVKARLILKMKGCFLIERSILKHFSTKSLFAQKFYLF